ncbi:unnamed protein product [Nyctereutes procyonoides]|uniref:(raccoon dog) hypothetical protein n=1 Tax=Nyctereutes procyonoides TaxID=34880 RepID=A0A811YFB9_NYCPR|nr:unnamed protein product [Nyctereutes procyonoides]
MAAAARGQERSLTRFVYVTRFGSHRCGGVLRLGGRRAQGRGNPGRRAACSPEEPRAAAPDGAELAPGPGPPEPAVSPPARASSAQSGTSPAARAGRNPGDPGSNPTSGSRCMEPASPSACLTQKNLAKKFDFPIPLNEASKIMKKKKKVSVWNKVYKVISRMLEENENYRLRLKYQQLSCEMKSHCFLLNYSKDHFFLLFVDAVSLPKLYHKPR